MPERTFVDSVMCFELYTKPSISSPANDYGPREFYGAVGEPTWKFGLQAHGSSDEFWKAARKPIDSGGRD